VFKLIIYSKKFIHEQGTYDFMKLKRESHRFIISTSLKMKDQKYNLSHGDDVYGIEDWS